jgi:hypothetical protein
MIPDLFYQPACLLNAENLPLGSRQAGQVVHHVELPPWANGSPDEFIRIHRCALPCTPFPYGLLFVGCAAVFLIIFLCAFPQLALPDSAMNATAKQDVRCNHGSILSCHHAQKAWTPSFRIDR